MPVATACYPEPYNLLKWCYPTEQSWRSSDVPHPVFCSFAYCPDWRITRFFLAHLVKFRNYILNQAMIIIPIHLTIQHPQSTLGAYAPYDWNVLSLIYSNVAVCGFCAVHWIVIICFPLLLYSYSIYFIFCNVLFMLCFLVLCVSFLFCLFCVFLLFCVLFLLLYVAVSFLFLYKFTDHCHRVEAKLQ